MKRENAPRPPMTTTTTETIRSQIVAELKRRQRFVITSHARPDGDAIGSSLAMAYALRQLGKDVRVVSKDPPPPPLLVFPGVADIEVTPRVDDPADAVIVMECGDLQRTGVAGLDAGFVVNIDHHPGNAMYGALNWFDLSAAA
jgi:phosphoesterase RecJ-like protein